MVGDGPDRDDLERRAHELGIMRDTLFLGYQADVAPFYAAFDVMRAAVGERGHAGERDRVARRRAAGRRDAGRRRAGRRGATARTGSSSSRATSRRWRTGSRSSPATRSCAPASAQPGRERVLPRYAVERLVDDIDELYRSLLAAKGIVPS